ncbi:MAG: hypothetical protein CSA05_01085 [Bacteroidia bacterium]|nr:MAG: hypothetical protein CSA05_01085 [Bacteroidia bacterium]
MQNNKRYERKFVVDSIPKETIELIIKQHRACFSQIYQERSINNIYLDTHNFMFYLDNNFGKGQRKKVRIRWYGDMLGKIAKPVLEFKIKLGAVGDKLSFRLKPFDVNRNFTKEHLRKVFLESDLPAWVIEDVLPLEPKLLNKYSRKYFLSADKNFRTTIDFNLQYFQIGKYNNCFIKGATDEKGTIVELKYKYDKDNLAELISNGFPFRLTKSSKYVNGIEKFYYNIPV